MRFNDYYLKKANWKWFTLTADDYQVHILFDNNENSCLLNEAKYKGKPLTGNYSVQVHSPHSYGQKHLHVYSKNNQIFSINWDGSAHDQSHMVYIPQKVSDAISQMFPGLKIPDNNYIESIMPDGLDKGQLKLLTD